MDRYDMEVLDGYGGLAGIDMWIANAQIDNVNYHVVKDRSPHFFVHFAIVFTMLFLVITCNVV